MQTGDLLGRLDEFVGSASLQSSPGSLLAVEVVAVLRLLISAVLHLAANVVGLLVASLLLDDMSVSAGAFVIAVLIFTVVEVIAGPLIRRIAIRYAHALTGSTALVTTFVGLVVTALISDGLEIDGAATWVLATVLVWLASLVAAVVLPAVFLKEAAERTKDRPRA